MPLSPIQIQHVTRVLNDITVFFAGFIKVLPEQNNLKFRNDPQEQEDEENPKCQQIYVPQDDIDNGIINSDLHIYIRQKKISSSTLASAVTCQLGNKPGYIRPSFGQLSYNSNKIINGEISPQDYQKLFLITVHEIIHILGFSKQHFTFKLNDKLVSQTIRGFQTLILSTPNMKKLAREYYDCPSLEGMQLENEGDEGSSGSHWEMTVLAHEIMVSVKNQDFKPISIFTVKALQDLGYYSEVNENYATQTYWGKGQGCGFYNQACYDDTNKYQEFFYPGFSQKNECSFQNNGKGIPYSPKYLDGCLILKSYHKWECEANQSQCFKSSLFNKYGQWHDSIEFQADQAICHQMKCLNNKNNSEIVIQIQFKDIVVDCKNEDAGRDKEIMQNGQKIGTIKCPYDYQKFCQPKQCKNNCSAHGFCLHGECICSPGYSSENCSHQCPLNQYAEINQNDELTCTSKCSEGTFANPDNTCKKTCPLSYFTTQEGKCEPCDFSCKQCTGPGRNECTACHRFSILKGNVCEEEPM